MKKLLRISVVLLLMCLIACTSVLTCFAGTVNTLNTTVKNDTVLFNGTVDGETLAVSIMVYDKSGDNLVSIASAAVDGKNEYNIEMQLSHGTYLVKVADYNGGEFLERTVTVGNTENKDENNTYAFTDESNNTWNSGDSKGLTFCVNGDFAKFTGLKIDGELIDKNYYTAVSGSTIITLKAEYLKTLSVGEHKLTVVYTDGECDTKFEIAKATNEQTKPSKQKTDITSPKTVDSTNVAVWLTILFVCVAVMMGTKVYKKYSEN